METFTQKWAIIALLEDAKEGSTFYYTDFPQHVTLAGVFATDRNEQQLVDGLIDLLRDQTPVAIEGDARAMFGSNADISVMKIKMNPELQGLYYLVYNWLEDLGVTYNSPEYQGEGYVPHCTIQKSGDLKQGEKRTLRSVSLVDMYPNSDGYQRKISKTIGLN